LNRDENVADWAGGEVQLSKQVGHWLTLTGGAEYRNDFHVRLQNYDLNPPATYQDTMISRDSYALYLQGEWRVLPNLILNAGARYDHYESFGDTAHPRVALIYHPVNQTTLKFLYGSAFRAPNAIENFYQDGYSSIASPNVKPEEVTTYELVAEQGIGRNLRVTAAAFLTEADDLIEGTSTLPYQYANLSQVEAKGIEVELQGAWTNGLRGTVSYTFTDTQDQDTHRSLDNSPNHLAKLGVIVPVWRDQVFGGVEVQYTSRRDTVAGNTVNDFVVANLTLFAQKLWGGWEASGSLYNLFDTQYRDPASGLDSVQQDGRQWRVKLTYRF
jgi:iron complex outermembrane receptor protein